MARSNSRSAAAQSIIADLARTPRCDSLAPLGARFVYSLRLIALHDRARRDPVPELAARLGSVETAAKALALAQAVQASWPESIHVGRFCCSFLSHDEATLGAMVDCAAARDRVGFERAAEGLIRPDRLHRLWDAVLALVAAEMRHS